ncbi:MAG: Gfo/Idh/MocA family oxidoreductase [Microthrixaceae bacterium]
MSAPRVTVVGAGIVGVRAARELLGPGADGRPTTAGVTLVSRRPERLEQLAGTSTNEVALVSAETAEPDLDADVVVVAREHGAQVAVAERALRAGAHVVCTGDDADDVRDLLGLDPLARAVGRTLAVGVAMSPGLTCLLARHGAALFDRVEEIHVARHGAGGPACARQRRRALRGTGTEWRDGAPVRRAGFSGRELCWFPDPIGGRDAYLADLPEPELLAASFPDLRRATARLAANRRDRFLVPFPMLIGPPVEGGPGAVRVELRGVRDGGRVDVVYGVLDRPSVAAAATAAVVALRVAGGGLPTGAHGLASLGDPLPVLRELARRGVRAATFEGSAATAGSGENLSESVQDPAVSAE